MARELTEAQKQRRLALRHAARKAAVAAGKDWTKLTADERKRFMETARENLRRTK
jgi:hypothetical protein